MHVTKKRILSGCLVISFAVFSMLAAAQEHSKNSCKDQPNPQDCMHKKMEHSRAEHEAKLHAALKLSPAQEPAWKTYTDSLHQQMAAAEADHKTMSSHADMEKMSMPDRLAQHLAMEQKRLTMMQSYLAALKTFYAVLTPGQQTTMDKAAQHFMHDHLHHQHHEDCC